MSKPIISLLHATVRPEQWKTTCLDWYKNCDDLQQVQYVLVSEEGILNSEKAMEIPFPRYDALANQNNKSAVGAWNYAAEKSYGDILFILADDFFSFPHWDTKVREVFADKVNEEAVVWINTGCKYDEEFMTHHLLTRKYYQRYGYILFPEYTSQYSDREFHDVAMRDGVVIDAREILMFNHRQWTRGKEGIHRDEINEKQEADCEWSKALYEKRKSENFPR